MNVTVAGVHMQGDEDAAAYGFGVDFAQALDNFGICLPLKISESGFITSALTDTRRRKSRKAIKQLSLSLASGAAWTAEP